MTQWLSHLYEQTDAFNTLAGNNNRLSKADLRAQMKYVLEEISELSDAIRDDDMEGIIDGLMDSYVTLSGLASRLKLLGYNLERAASLVGDNNLSKFPSSEAVADMTITAFADQGIKCTKFYNEEFRRWAILDQNCKVRKPVGYTSVDLSACVPNDVE